MSGLKTFLFLLFCVFGSALAPKPTAAGVMDDPLYRFASCTGRLSALMEFQWLTDGPASEETRQLRDMMIELVEAIMPQGQGPKVLAWRIDAKAAQSKLLTSAYFATDSDQALWSMARATQQIDECRALLLS